MASGQLVFQPPKFNWHSEDQQQAFEEWKGQIILALHSAQLQQRKFGLLQSVWIL